MKFFSWRITYYMCKVRSSNQGAKKAQSAEEVRPLAAGLRAQVVTAGVPEDHVDLFVNKWVESAQACHGNKFVGKDECYKTALEWVPYTLEFPYIHSHYHSHHDAAQPAVGEYHHGFMGKENSAWKDVKWETVKAAKMGFFESAKLRCLRMNMRHQNDELTK